MKPLKEYTKEELLTLCQELRTELVENVSTTGGHLSSNLGTVELMVAIHRVFQTETDRLVFDVGHQCYVHKMLTGRRDQMKTLRQWGGLAGFPKPSESDHDAFIAGHASNAVAVAVGMAQARTLQQESYKVMALLGDGALTGGLAYEGLATGGDCSGQLLVILNDNGMSIAKNVGGISRYLAEQRLKPQYLSFRETYRKLLGSSAWGREIHQINHKIKQAVKSTLLPCSFFEQMGFTYYGPVDGHDVEALTKILNYAKVQENPVFLHVRTTKGKGYPPAEENPGAFHGVAPFNGKTGELPPSTGSNFSKVFGETMVELGKKHSNLCGITAAMPTGTGLDLFGQAYPQRLYDVGIAEGCGTAFTGGLAKQGAIPVFAVYSTFLQRAYDMVIHDVALDSLHGIIAVDRAGLVGEDGETHHGVFDVAFLRMIPNFQFFAPSSFQELREMLRYAVEDVSQPVALRYPRGGEGNYQQGYSGNPCDVLQEGEDITLVSYGMNINEVLACGKLLAKEGISSEVVKINRMSPLDASLIGTSVKKTGRLVVVEEVVQGGCLGEGIVTDLVTQGICPKVKLINLGQEFVTHGTTKELKKICGLHPQGIYEKCQEVLQQ